MIAGWVQIRPDLAAVRNEPAIMAQLTPVDP
jgi:hypothetical protein